MAVLVMLIYGGIGVFTLAVRELFCSPSVSQSVCLEEPEALFFSKNSSFWKDWTAKSTSSHSYSQIFNKGGEKRLRLIIRFRPNCKRLSLRPSTVWNKSRTTHHVCAFPSAECITNYSQLRSSKTSLNKLCPCAVFSLPWHSRLHLGFVPQHEMQPRVVFPNAANFTNQDHGFHIACCPSEYIPVINESRKMVLIRSFILPWQTRAGNLHLQLLQLTPDAAGCSCSDTLTH